MMRVIKARFRDIQSFLEALNADLPYGGMFCATTQPLKPEEEVLVEVRFPALPNKMMLRATVVDWRSALPRLGVRAGAMVAFFQEDEEKKNFLLEVARGRRTDAIKRKHSRLPVVMPVRWRHSHTTESQQAHLRDISIGGAQLVTEHKLDPDTDLVLELVVPGGAQPIQIAAKVSNQTANGYGIRFVYRDGGGSRRLREVMRRLIHEGS